MIYFLPFFALFCGPLVRRFEETERSAPACKAAIPARSSEGRAREPGNVALGGYRERRRDVLNVRARMAQKFGGMEVEGRERPEGERRKKPDRRKIGHLHNIPLSQRSTGTLSRNTLQEAQIALHSKLTLLLLSLGRCSTEPAGETSQSTTLILLNLARSFGVRCWWVPQLVVCWRVGEGDERTRGGSVDELVGAGESGRGLYI